MSRSRDSDEDEEYKTGFRQSRILDKHSSANSSLRRSSRIKRNKSLSRSPESETSSISSYQTRSTKKRIGIMDSTASETLKKQDTKSRSTSPDISELTDVDIPGTPGRRTTRSSFATFTSTTSKINTRATNKRLTRAGSETKSSPSIRTTRRTRASSVDLEPLMDQNRSQPSTPVNTRRRGSVLQSNTSVKEEIKKKNSSKNIQLDTTIVEADEILTSDAGNLDSSSDYIIHSQQSKKSNQKRKSVDEDKVGEDNSYDETLQSLKKKNERHSKHLDEVTVDEEKNLVEGKFSSEENLMSEVNADTIADETSTHNNSLNSSKYEKGNKLEMMKGSLPEIEVTLVDICKKSFAKELGNKTENLLNISVEEQKKSPGDKENQTMNIISDTSIEKSVPPITSATTLCTKSLTSANKSLNEKETKSVELSLSKQRLSRGSIETVMKNTAPSKVFTDEVIEEIILSSPDSSSPDIIFTKKKLDSVSINETIKRRISMDSITNNVDIKLTTTNVTNKSVLLKDSSKELISENNIEGQISVKNESESDNINNTECIIENSKDSDKNESGEANEISHLPAKKIKTQEKNSSSESLNSSVFVVDDNEMTLLLEERSPSRENEVSSNVVPLSPNHSVNAQICVKTSSLINKSFNDKPIVTTKRSTEVEDNVTDNTDSTEQGQKNECKYVTESVSKSSNAILESINSNDSSADNAIQDNQSPDVIEALEKSATNISSPEEMKKKSKNISSENTAKRNSIQKSKDTFDNSKTEKKSSQLEESKKTTDYDSDVNIGISSFHDIPADKWEKNTIKLTEKPESENETESDLIFVDSQAWLASKGMTASQDEILSEKYDSDDTAVLESQLEELQANYDAKRSGTEKLIDFDTEEEDAVKSVKTQKSLIKKRSTSSKNKDLLTGSTEEEEILKTSDKFVDESETVLNHSNDRSTSELNKSEQAAKTTERTSRLRDESDEKIGEDADKSNRSSQVSKENTSLRKSIEGRKSLNKSSKDEASKQSESSVQNISRNKSRTDTSEEELDNADAHREKKLQNKKRFWSKLLDTDTDNDTTGSEKKESLLSKDNVKKNKKASLNNSSNKKSKPINTKVSSHSNNDESSDSETAIDLKNSSMVAYAGSSSDSSDHSIIPNILFSKSNDDDTDSSVNSDIKREYNLDGVEPKFSDDSVPADECRDSEVESSDPDDNGSDLADFIVDDEEIEDEEEEDNKEKEKRDEYGQSIKKHDKDEEIEDEEVEDNEEKEKSDEDEDGQSIEKDIGKDIEDEEVDVEGDDEQENEVDVEGDNEQENEVDVEGDDEQKNKIEDENDKQDLDVEGENEEDAKGENDVVNQKENTDEEIPMKIEMEDNTMTIHFDKLSKVHKDKKNKSIEYISPRISKTKKRQGIKMKSSMKENEENILLDTSNLTHSIKKKKKSYLEDSLKNITEHNPIEQLSESEMTLPEKVKSRMLSSTPISAYQKYKINKESEIDQRIPGTKDTKTDSVNTIQNISKKLKKKKSKKESVSENINSEQFSDTSNKEKTLSSDFLSGLLEVVEKTDHSKSTFKTIKSRRTISNTFNIESPTIKYLRKEKLNDSAPASLTFDAEINQLKEKLSTSEKEVLPNAVMSPDDNVIQQCSQRKQKKRKRQMEEMSNETIDKVLPQDTLESNIPKNKRAKLSKLSIIKNTTDTCQINEKKKRKKKKKKQQQIDTTEKNENVNEDIPQEDIRENKMELAQHKKKKNKKEQKIASNSELNSPADNDMAMKKKVKKTVESQGALSEDPPKKEKKGKKEKKLLQLQNIPDTIESSTSAFVKARNEAREAIRAAEKHIKAKRLQEKDREDIKNKKIQERDMNTYTKKREKEVSKEKNKFESRSTGGLKRLSDDVIENLSDMPTRARKRQKTSQNEKQILPSMPQTRKKIIATHREYNIPINSCGSTTKFSVVNLRKTMVRPSTTDACVSTSMTTAILVKNLTRKLLDGNARIPGISYKMFSDNRFK